MKESKKNGGQEQDKKVNKPADLIAAEQDPNDDPVELRQKNKSLMAIIVVLTGVAVGSLFVDLVQYFKGDGYSERALKDKEVFVKGDKTWVAFEDPAVKVKLLTTDESEFEQCPTCDPKAVFVWLKYFIPTMVAEKVTVSSEEGKVLVEKYGIKTVPAFIFSNDIQQTNFYQQEASVLFKKKDDRYLLETAGLGVPVGKYLEAPEIFETDAVLGNREAPVKIVVFSDFQCPYCNKFYQTITKLVQEYGDKVALVYKDMPLSFHPQSLNAAMATKCAKEQEKFWEFSDLLYANQKEWGETEGTAVFKRYATREKMDRKKFDACLDKEKFKQEVIADFEQAQQFGLSGTPATFINKEFINGVIEEVELKKMIDEELDSRSENLDTNENSKDDKKQEEKAE